MARSTTTLAEVLTRIVARIIAQVTDATVSTCYMSLDPMALPAPNPGDFIYVVSPHTNGQFDDRLFDGAGTSDVHVSWPIVVTIHSTAINDESGRDTEFLTNATRGIVTQAGLILKALAGHDLQESTDTDEILAQPIIPSDAALNRTQPEKGKGFMQFGFMVQFDWDVS